jgi:hypothetical protein
MHSQNVENEQASTSCKPINWNDYSESIAKGKISVVKEQNELQCVVNFPGLPGMFYYNNRSKLLNF